MKDRHRQFVNEYLADAELNAASAYRRVYPQSAPASARRNASKLLGRSDIAAAVAEEMDRRTCASKVNADWIVNQLRREAEFHGEGSTHSGRVRALELLGRYLGLFQDRVKLEGSVGVGVGVKLEIVEEIVDAPPADRDAAAA